MIYDSLDVLPIKTFYKIQETGQFDLLDTNSNSTEEQQDLQVLYDRLSAEFEALTQSDGLDRDFFLRREISHLESVKKVCTLGIEILKFEYNEEIKNEIAQLLNYNIRTKITAYYYKDLERCEKKVLLIDKKISQLSSQLTKPKKTNEKGGTIDDALAAVCTILGVSFDFNSVPCTTYIAYKKQADSKIKVQQEQLSKLKAK